MIFVRFNLCFMICHIRIFQLECLTIKWRLCWRTSYCTKGWADLPTRQNVVQYHDHDFCTHFTIDIHWHPISYTTCQKKKYSQNRDGRLCLNFLFLICVHLFIPLSLLGWIFAAQAHMNVSMGNSSIRLRRPMRCPKKYIHVKFKRFRSTKKKRYAGEKDKHEQFLQSIVNVFYHFRGRNNIDYTGKRDTYNFDSIYALFDSNISEANE